jgi:arginyl-tRNA synthetase
MKLVRLGLPGAYLVEIEPREDERGFFARTFCARELAAAGLDARVAQTSLSWNPRRGTLRGLHITLDELVDEVGADPIRYFMISRSANSPIDFDLDLAVEHSDKNPVYYIQNAHVRCAGIFRKWVEAGYEEDADREADLSLLAHERELAFLRKALELSDVIEVIATTYEPHRLAFYAYDLAALFHQTYEGCRVLHSDVPEPLRLARLRFYRAAKVVFARVLELMGMSAPDVM